MSFRLLAVLILFLVPPTAATAQDARDPHPAPAAWTSTPHDLDSFDEFTAACQQALPSATEREKAARAGQPEAGQLAGDDLSLLAPLQREWLAAVRTRIPAADVLVRLHDLGAGGKAASATAELGALLAGRSVDGRSVADALLSLSDDRLLFSDDWEPEQEDVAGDGIVFDAASHADEARLVSAAALIAPTRDTLGDIKRLEREWPRQTDHDRYLGSDFSTAFVCDQGERTLLRFTAPNGDRYETYVLHAVNDPTGAHFEVDSRIVDFFAADGRLVITKWWILPTVYDGDDIQSHGVDVYMDLRSSNDASAGVLMLSSQQLECDVSALFLSISCGAKDRIKAVNYTMGNAKRLMAGAR
jgi:hypothetical protein